MEREVVSSNPGTMYQMDDFSHCTFYEEKVGRRWSIFLKQQHRYILSRFIDVQRVEVSVKQSSRVCRVHQKSSLVNSTLLPNIRISKKMPNVSFSKRAIGIAALLISLSI